jgi:hypothetical protein
MVAPQLAQVRALPLRRGGMVFSPTLAGTVPATTPASLRVMAR